MRSTAAWGLWGRPRGAAARVPSVSTAGVEIQHVPRKSEHKRKFDETGVDDIESSQEVDEYGTPLCFLAKKGFKKK